MVTCITSIPSHGRNADKQASRARGAWRLATATLPGLSRLLTVGAFSAFASEKHL
jgi:hypothetical protein